MITKYMDTNMIMMNKLLFLEYLIKENLMEYFDYVPNKEDDEYKGNSFQITTFRKAGITPLLTIWDNISIIECKIAKVLNYDEKTKLLNIVNKMNNESKNYPSPIKFFIDEDTNCIVAQTIHYHSGNFNPEIIFDYSMETADIIIKYLKEIYAYI